MQRGGIEITRWFHCEACGSYESVGREIGVAGKVDGVWTETSDVFAMNTDLTVAEEIEKVWREVIDARVGAIPERGLFGLKNVEGFLFRIETFVESCVMDIFPKGLRNLLANGGEVQKVSEPGETILPEPRAEARENAAEGEFLG